MPNFREYSPQHNHNFQKPYKSYRSYKKYLVLDFNNCCGYCNGHDTWNGGPKSYHIDHFAPQDKFPQLETQYDNLIYACPSCNLAKSNKWYSNNSNTNSHFINGKGLQKPTEIDFNIHFVRDADGAIQGNTVEGVFMVKTLKLNLERHSIIWRLTRLQNLITSYNDLIVNQKVAGNDLQIAIKTHYTLLKVFYKYHSKFRALNV